MQAIQRAAVGNLELQRERILIETSEATLLAARGVFDFRLVGDLAFQRTTTPPLTAEDIAGGFRDTITANLGVVRQLETGGNLRVDLRTNTNRTNSRFECGTITSMALQSACTFYGSNLDLTFTHPLLRGFGTNVALAAVRRQRIQRDQALLNRQTRAANILRDVITSYWELAYASRDLAIRQSAVELAREQLRITKAQIDVGRLAPVDAAAVERAIGERLQEVALSEQAVFFRSLELRRLFGLPTATTVAAFAAAEVPQGGPRDINIDQEVQRALEMNPQLRALRLGLQLSEVDLATAASSLRPRLDFVGRIGSTGRRPEFADALETTLGFDQATWSAGLTFDLPIGNRTAKGQMRAAELGTQRVRLEATDFELALRDLVIRLAAQIRTASRRVELARATVGYAQQNLEAERARFSVGRSTNNDVLLRQQELKAEEIRELRATVDLLVNETALLASTGEILERYNLSLKGL
jgi:outer membrane protein TolC